MKIKTGWLALAFVVAVSTVGVGTWYYQSNNNNSAKGTSVPKAQQTGFDVSGGFKVSIEE